MVTEAEARRLRPFMSGVIALVVSLVAAIGWYFLGRPDESTQPVRTVDWKPFVQAGRTEGALLLFAPTRLPDGWRATSVTYSGGAFAQWHLGMLTGDRKYVAIEESRVSVKDLVETNIDEDAVQGKDTEVAGETWQTWTDSGGDFGLTRLVPPSGSTPAEAVLVYGAAPRSEIIAFAKTLDASS